MLFKRNEVWITRAAPFLLLICTAARRWRTIRTWYLKRLASHLTRWDKNGRKPFVASHDHSFSNIFREENVVELSIFSRLATKVLFQFTKDEKHLSPHTMFARYIRYSWLCSWLMILPFCSRSSFVFALVNRVSHYSVAWIALCRVHRWLLSNYQEGREGNIFQIEIASKLLWLLYFHLFNLLNYCLQQKQECNQYWSKRKLKYVNMLINSNLIKLYESLD